VFSERHNHSIAILCDVLEVSRSGYYKWLKRGVSERLKKRAELLQRILEIFEESRENYGSPRVYEQLRSEGWTCNHKVVEELMRLNEIRARRSRQYRCTTDSTHSLPVAENLLEQNFQVEEPDEVWVSDITYIPTQQGWLYLCVFIDLFTRGVIGWSMSDRMTTDLVVDAFEMGMGNRSRAPIVVHSDRGSQYASDLFRGELERFGCIQSMSRKGNCWDNAVAESFFGTLKEELIYREKFDSRIRATLAIFEYIEVFYNKKRLHSALGYLTPEEKGLKGEKAA
jgi:transposase InsO family protein